MPIESRQDMVEIWIVIPMYSSTGSYDNQSWIYDLGCHCYSGIACPSRYAPVGPVIGSPLVQQIYPSRPGAWLYHRALMNPKTFCGSAITHVELVTTAMIFIVVISAKATPM